MRCGLPRKPHTEACRAKFKEAMKETERVNTFDVKKREFKKKLEEEKKKEDKRDARKREREGVEEERRYPGEGVLRPRG